MSITQKIELRGTQSLVLTPQLAQAIKLLQLSNIELTAYVEQELEKNPLLEREGPEDGAQADVAGETDRGPEAPETPPNGSDPQDTLAYTNNDAPADEQSSPLDTDYDNIHTGEAQVDRADPAPWSADAAPRGTRGADSTSGGDDWSLEHHLTRPQTLREHLVEQVGVELRDPVDQAIGLQMVEMVNDAGYLEGDLGELAERLSCPVSRVEAVLARLQKLDPPGIFARDLAEALAIQLREKDRFDPCMQALVQNLDLLAKRDLAGLCRACGVDEEDLLDMVQEIRALNPRPASGFDESTAEPVIPDILMRPTPDGSWLVELNPDTLPRVLVNDGYYAVVNKQARKKSDREYIGACYSEANWLVKALRQRATTIMKVSTEIVRQQSAFFDKGVEHMRPLILRDIAEAIEMHESTVSRVTANKFMATPRGIFELKFFFTAAIPSTSGGPPRSAEAVRYRIRGLIDAEARDAILSDDSIVEILRSDGIDIARRTVAKYRESMSIPSSVQRRREKSAPF